MTAGETARLKVISDRLRRLGQMLGHAEIPSDETPVETWFTFLEAVKAIQGNASNDLAFVTALMAKDYLLSRYLIRELDVSLKPEGAPGLDIDAVTASNQRIVAEIKATVPYRDEALGANQEVTFKKDFAKLRAAAAEHKFFFVTDVRTFSIVKKRYRKHLAGVEVILLPKPIDDENGGIS